LHYQFHVAQAFFSGAFVLLVLLDAFRKVVGFGHELSRVRLGRRHHNRRFSVDVRM